MAAGVPNEQVTVHTMMLGGGFGRRGAIQEYVRQAVLIAKEVDAPVKLVWTREEDMQPRLLSAVRHGAARRRPRRRRHADRV